MAASNWLVVVTDAYAAWLEVSEPSPADERAMIGWLVDLERKGPPSMVGVAANGLREAEGPNGERIEHDVIATPLNLPTPPFGIIAIKRIGPR